MKGWIRLTLATFLAFFALQLLPLAHLPVEAYSASSIVGAHKQHDADSSTSSTVTLPASVGQAELDPALPVVVVVDKTNHLTHALQLQGSNETAEFVDVLAIPNATGKPSTPTPNGRTTVKEKRLDPVWTPPVSIDPRQRPVAPYSKTHRNPLGVAWIGLNKGALGLHGTNNPNSIGKSVSHGCVRHQNNDVLKLYDMVSIDTPVYLTRHFEGTVVRLSDFTPTAPKPVSP